MKKGDFSGLAQNYARYRPSYNKVITGLILDTVGKNRSDIRATDVGAGTGIFSRCLLDAGVGHVTAVEPNDDMRREGEKARDSRIEWIKGSGEATTLANSSADLEPPRDCRRLPLLSRRSHYEQDHEQIFS